jgi:hypothetical protein
MAKIPQIHVQYTEDDFWNQNVITKPFQLSHTFFQVMHTMGKVTFPVMTLKQCLMQFQIGTENHIIINIIGTM